ncbi:MAG: alpha/beta hydrolase [Clostridiales bacterium]|nr:alpha/beta hydrolase [Clostridiales bacterium]
MKILIIIIAIAALLIIISSIYFLRLSLVRASVNRSRTLLREDRESIDKHAELSERAIKLKHEKLHLEAFDKLKLCAYFFPADIDTPKTVICVHGYRASGLHDHAANILYYHDRGYNVLVPDVRAHGESEGRYIGFGWLDRLDCKRWCEHLYERYGVNCNILLHGISMGSATVICTAGEHPPALAGVIADCSYTSGFEQFRHVARNYLHIPEFPLLYTTALLVRMVCGYSLRKCSPLESIKRADVPFLIIHGSSDSFVPTEMSERLYNACPTDKKLLIVDGARHAESNAVAPELYYGEIEKFMNKLGF